MTKDGEINRFGNSSAVPLDGHFKSNSDTVNSTQHITPFFAFWSFSKGISLKISVVNANSLTQKRTKKKKICSKR